MSPAPDQIVKNNLTSVLSELRAQRDLATHFGGDQLTFDELMAQIEEYLEVANEYALAYETIVATAESFPFSLSSRAAVKLLEVGLLMGFKTDRPQDAVFRVHDNRDS